MPRRRLLTMAALCAVPLSLAGCAAAGPTSRVPGTITVVASFYPLQYVAERVGGDSVRVSSLTPAGAEPHDLELSLKQTRIVGDADLVVYLSGFQPAVDAAIAARAPRHVLDAAATAGLVTFASEGAVGTTGGSAQASNAATGPLDPHFWLDPTRLPRLADAVGAQLAQLAPANAASYQSRAAAASAELMALDGDYSQGLQTCQRREVVTAHAAFGYLADRYHLQQVGIAGLEPDAQPSGARLRQVSDIVRQTHVTTIFFERLVSPKVAETLATDLGIASAVLDPIEGLSDPASDYRGIMRQNLTTLRTALGCS
jgi:zinc transport system substrate-binding protein